MGWRDELPEDIRESTTLADIEDVSSMAKQFIDQSKFLGNSIRLPGEDATPEARAEFRKKLMDKSSGLMEVPNLEDAEAMETVFTSLGRPEKADGYEKPEIDGAAFDKARFKRLSEAAHKAGISKKQFKDVMGEILTADAELVGSANTTRETDMAELRTDWGPAYEGKLQKAAKLAELTNAPAGLVKAISAGKVDAATLKWLDGLGASLGGETAELINQGIGGETGMTKSEARERSQEILETLTKMQQSDPRYQELLQKRMALMKIATGER
jgi:hypothetical protein